MDGSRVSVYRTAEPLERHVVGEGGEDFVSFDVVCNPESVGQRWHVHVAARTDLSQSEDLRAVEFNGAAIGGEYERQATTARDREGTGIKYERQRGRHSRCR